MKTIVVYRSISGFTKKYATWIAEELKADISDAREIGVEKLKQYDLIIFGGSLHAVGINGLKLIKDNFMPLTGKVIVIFAVGASPSRAGLLEEIRDRNFTEDELRNLRFYYLRGGFDFNKLDLVNKVLMTLLKIRLGMKSQLTPDEKGMLAAYEKPLDCTRRENIKEIIDYVNSLK